MCLVYHVKSTWKAQKLGHTVLDVSSRATLYDQKLEQIKTKANIYLERHRSNKI